MKSVLILFLAIVLFGCTTNQNTNVQQPKKTYKFLVFYSNNYVDTVCILTRKTTNTYTYSVDGTNYISNGGRNYLSTTAPIKMLENE
ncbi:hypothetical protein M0Q97_10655 [Candidatus Dojkabacteria bacterium]|jgi:hypothetical protein|nr:hypothetical protein [Candidatus Dojkabacteria bacterium]